MIDFSAWKMRQFRIIELLILILGYQFTCSCGFQLFMSPKNSQQQMTYGVEFDYSAVNEYVKAHYDSEAPSEPYFLQNEGVLERIYNAREGVLFEGCNETKEGCENTMANANLRQNGFALHTLPTKVTDFTNLTLVEEKYVPELEQFLEREYEMCSNSQESKKILHVSFWNPMVRGEDCQISRPENNDPDEKLSTPTASTANMVHIDTDVGAYSNIRDIVTLVEKNRIGSNNTKFKCKFEENEKTNSCFPREKIIDMLENGYRFAIINFWRNIKTEPITQSPLCIYHTQYDTTSSTTKKTFKYKNHKEYTCFPYASPDTNKSKWYMFDNMSHDECLMFLQYDRLVSQTSDLWHCALPNSNNEESINDDGRDKNLRKSFDVRAFVVFDEKVPHQLDRFREDRTRPILSFEESGCFCDKQAEERTNDEYHS